MTIATAIAGMLILCLGIWVGSILTIVYEAISENEFRNEVISRVMTGLEEEYRPDPIFMEERHVIEGKVVWRTFRQYITTEQLFQELEDNNISWKYEHKWLVWTNLAGNKTRCDLSQLTIPPHRLQYTTNEYNQCDNREIN